jgi:hypothetical protein
LLSGKDPDSAIKEGSYMNRNTRFRLGMLAMTLTFGLILTGCPNDAAANGGGPSVEELAKQLAAAINALEAGSATVNGATVTLSKYLSIESQFTVPAGVTLDLTGDGELGLLDATLTVNGTVNAGSHRIRLRTAAREATINGSGTIQLKGKGTSSGSRPAMLKPTGHSPLTALRWLGCRTTTIPW